MKGHFLPIVSLPNLHQAEWDQNDHPAAHLKFLPHAQFDANLPLKHELEIKEFMSMVRSQKSIGGVVGVAVGSAPYKIGDL